MDDPADPMRTQAEHDAAHPGMRCQHCPVEIYNLARIWTPWWRRWLTRRA